jgi:hypothetical protein
MRSIDDSQTICGFGIVRFIEILVYRFEKSLFLLVVIDTRGCPTDNGIIALDRTEGVSFHTAGEKCLDDSLKFPRDIVLPMELGFVEDIDKDVLCQDVLDHHLPDIL